MLKKSSKKPTNSFSERVYPVRKNARAGAPEWPMGQAFSNGVYGVVEKISSGEVMTYKEVAMAVGSPKAYRAVGNALNKNPDLRNIPCHRVVMSDGKIGGYRFGTKKKAALLAREGLIIKNGRIAK
jgi:methylated-DNA-[protein]-cysteine S-methyltransferase